MTGEALEMVSPGHVSLSAESIPPQSPPIAASTWPAPIDTASKLRDVNIATGDDRMGSVGSSGTTAPGANEGVAIRRGQSERERERISSTEATSTSAGTGRPTRPWLVARTSSSSSGFTARLNGNYRRPSRTSDTMLGEDTREEHLRNDRPPSSYYLSSSVNGRRDSDQRSTASTASVSPPSRGSDTRHTASSSPPGIRTSVLDDMPPPPQASSSSASAAAVNVVASTAPPITPMMSGTNRVLRSAQLTAAGTSSSRLVSRTAPRSTARSVTGPKARRVAVYEDPDAEEQAEKEKEKEIAQIQTQGHVQAECDERVSDYDSPGAAGSKLLASTREKEKSDGAQMLSSGAESDKDNPLGGSSEVAQRAVHPLQPMTTNALPHPQRPVSTTVKGRRPPQSATLEIEPRSGSHLPGWEVGAGDEDDVDDAAGSAIAAVLAAPRAKRSEAYPYHRRLPSSQPGSDENVDPYHDGGAQSRRAASALGLESVRKAPSPPTALAADLPGVQRRVQSAAQPPSHTQPNRSYAPGTTPGTSTVLEPVCHAPRVSVVEDKTVAVQSDSEEFKQKLFEEAMLQEAARQHTLPQSKIDEWTRGKVTEKHTNVRGFRFRKIRKAGEGGFSTVWVVRGPCERLSTAEHYPEEQQAYFAMKQVNLKKIDPGSREGVLKEADYLEALARLPGYDEHILRYFAHKANESHLKILIELGDCDFSDVLRQGLPDRWDVVKIFGQMIEAVHFLHEAGIVHTDLKPANFLRVGNKYKIIDLGIAQKIPMGTIHISRDALIGTPNYMAPEAIKVSRTRGAEGRSEHLYKAGCASDVWSMGCILFQMVYSRPPFDRFSGEAKMRAIVDPSHAIEYSTSRYRDEPAAEVVDEVLIDCMRSALQYRVSDRATIPELL
ncbi:kinase-like protein, partial [Tilletiaria anomala UBC 951]